jgi:hypothetical protein
MKNLLLFFVVCFAGALNAQQHSDLRVLSEDRQSLTIEYTPTISSETIRANDGNDYVKFNFSLGQALPGKPGEPMVQYRAIAVVLPTKRCKVSILRADTEEKTGIKPAFLPRYKSEDMGISAVYDAPKSLAPSVSILPTSYATINSIGESRGMIIGTLTLNPVRIDYRSQTAHLIKRLVVRLDFDQRSELSPLSSSFITSNLPVGTRQQTVRVAKIATNSPLADGDWYKIEIPNERTAEGIYKLDYNYFKNNSIISQNINNFRIYGNGGTPIPEDLNAKRPNGLEEVARLVVDQNGNGQFDSEDYILFYGCTTNGWTYTANSFSHYINPYADKNVYFFSFGSTTGKSMVVTPSPNVSNAPLVEEFQGLVFNEEEKYNVINSGRQWFGQKLTNDNTSRVYTQSLPGLITIKNITYRLAVLGRAPSSSWLKFYENNQQFGAWSFSQWNIDGDYGIYANNLVYTLSGNLTENRSVLRVELEATDSRSEGYIDWIEILYSRAFTASNNVLLFHTPPNPELRSYSVSGFSGSTMYVFDVTAHGDVKQIVPLGYQNGVVTFQARGDTLTPRKFLAVASDGLLSAGTPTKIKNSNLHGSTSGAEYVVIAPKEFLSEAQRLADYRKSSAPDQLSSVVVDIESIQNEFGGGLTDPMALREFCLYASQQWAIKPSYICLFGAGHYDYRNIKTTKRNFIPPYETVESNDDINSYTSDDAFVQLDPGSNRPGLAIGRISAKDATDARRYVDHVIAYENNSPYDTWRNRATFVADDQYGENRSPEGDQHMGGSEKVIDQSIPASVEKNKIYTEEYPTVNTASGLTKPDAAKAIVNAFNEGTLIMNFIGHGNPVVWTHEKILTRDGTLPQLTNLDKLTFLVTATCSFNENDNPFEESAGERITLLERGGAIAMVGAMRKVYSGENENYLNVLYPSLFGRDAQRKNPRLGDVIWASKQAGNPLGYTKYNLLGDPGLRLAMPRMSLTVDSVNGISPSTSVTMKVMGKSQVKGNVRKVDGGVQSNFTGKGLIEVFDSQRRITFPGIADFEFFKNGSLLYRGTVRITNGAYQATFPIPKDVSYETNPARISIYAWSDSTDGIGYTDNVVIGGIAVDTSNDKRGPEIEVGFDDEQFRPEDIVKPSTILIVRLKDSSGINTSTAGVGHMLSAKFSYDPGKIDLAPYYQSDLDTYVSGAVHYPLKDIPEGKHTVMVQAWDIRNNSSTSEVPFEVRSTETVALFNVYNYPNPFSSATTFTFQRNSTTPVDAEIKIYTIAGRLVETINVYGLVDRFAQIPWQGRDRDGAELANGVYFYKVILRAPDGSGSAETLEKLAIVR